MADPARWEPVVEALQARGFDAQLRVGFLGMRSILVDVGGDWQASITTGTGSIDDFSGAEPIRVGLFGPGIPGECYSVTWWPETTDIRRLAAALAPLLHRVSVAPRPMVEEAPEVLDVATAEPALRALFAALGPQAVLQPAVLWRVFSSFALRSVDGVSPERDEDLVLFETTSRRGLHLVRQFDVDDEMEQLSCTLRVDDDLPTATLWGQAGGNASRWIAEVEVSPAFQHAIAASGTRFDFTSSVV